MSDQRASGTNIAIVTAITAILATTFGGLLSLLGTHFANQSTKEITKSQFAHQEVIRQADLRRDVYIEFLTGVWDYAFVVARASKEGKLNQPATRSNLVTERARLIPKLTKLAIVGSEKSIEEANVLADDIKKLSDSTSSRQAKKAYDMLVDDVVKFVKAISPELQLPQPLPGLQLIFD